jgi:CMP-N-acetylneuraminic acid synthetase
MKAGGGYSPIPAPISLRVSCEPAGSPFTMWQVDGRYLESLVESRASERCNRPHQALPTAYGQIGILDVICTATVTDDTSVSGRRIVPMIVDTKLAVDIHDERSLRHAERVARDRVLTSER